MPDRPGLIALLLFTPLLFIASANSELFKWKGDDGHIFYSDQAPSGEKPEVMEYKVRHVSVTSSSNKDTDYNSANGKTVVMYSATWCGVCKKAKAYFAAESIPYKDYDIENSRKGRADYKRLKGTGIPIIMVDKERLNGFSQGKFDKAYEG